MCLNIYKLCANKISMQFMTRIAVLHAHSSAEAIVLVMFYCT